MQAFRQPGKWFWLVLLPGYCMAAEATDQMFSLERTVVLPAGVELTMAPVSGYVDGWCNNLLSDGPYALLASVADQAAVDQWASASPPRQLRLETRLRFHHDDAGTRLEVRWQVAGLDKQWHQQMEALIDRFLARNLVPYVDQLSRPQHLAAR